MEDSFTQAIALRQRMRPNHKRDYISVAPKESHFTRVDCETANCGAWRNGWRIRVEGLPAAMLHTARTSGRKFTPLHISEDENWLVFEAGQRCFHTHEVRLPKPELFLVDNNGSIRVHSRVEDWVEDVGEHTGRIADILKEG